MPAEIDPPRVAAPAPRPKTAPKLSTTARAVLYREHTERLRALSELVRDFAPCSTEGNLLIDPLRGDDQDDDVLSARNLALEAAYKAIRAIAAEDLQAGG